MTALHLAAMHGHVDVLDALKGSSAFDEPSSQVTARGKRFTIFDQLHVVEKKSTEFCFYGTIVRTFCGEFTKVSAKMVLFGYAMFLYENVH